MFTRYDNLTRNFLASGGIAAAALRRSGQDDGYQRFQSSREASAAPAVTSNAAAISVPLGSASPNSTRIAVERMGVA